MIKEPQKQERPERRPSIAPNCSLSDQERIEGGVKEEGGERWFRIDGVERMEPFLMSLASDSDHWLFMLSTGALTAGRKDPDHALFPYYTQDKMADMSAHTGSRTVLLVKDAAGQSRHWEPFATAGLRDKAIRRSLQKNELGNHIILEERHEGIGLCIRVSWRPSGRFGFVRKVELTNTGEETRDLRILDGLQNVLPAGLSQRFQNEFSILADAYKQNELKPEVNLGIYGLSSVPTDLAHPMESLRANVVWRAGMEADVHLLTDRQLSAFREGRQCSDETYTRGRRGCYLGLNHLSLEAGETREWYTCADIEQEVPDVEALSEWLASEKDIPAAIEEDCRLTSLNLRGMLAEADGFQCTDDPRRIMRHTSNTLFNLMRGGALITGYELPAWDLRRSMVQFNKQAAAALEPLLNDKSILLCGDPWRSDSGLEKAGRDVVRLLREYLPLSFSRRHGDPSRPWNRFSIEIKENDGSPRFYYQGNWRDIFQNWEALLQSYPEYLEAAICRFLNASTADGYNPYRLTKDGFEWEVLEAGDDWANIGYWGDHQIIYLLRLLESSTRYHPEKLASLLNQETCVYAEIPYRIRPHQDILKDPRTTIDYDEAWAERIAERVNEKGTDGKLLHGPDGQIAYVTLIEKLLVPLMSKLANFVPDGGIWMNTQRPEWNDANNALVGYGVSVVTLGYVHRYLEFLNRELGSLLKQESFAISTEVAELLEDQLKVFSGEPGNLSAAERFDFMERLSEPASQYRQKLYERSLSGEKRTVSGAIILDYVHCAREHVSQCLLRNRREDRLWHSYNLLELGDRKVDLQNLVVMLEGQVSILSSGLLDAPQALELLESLRASALYREDQDSYILYPDKDLPRFLQKNKVPASAVEKNAFLRTLVKSGDGSIIRPRRNGGYAFNGRFHNSTDLKAALEGVLSRPEFSSAVDADVEDTMALFERTFNHHAFTGRSGTFFAYEGLGSIYWHMVSKLVLAVQEVLIETDDAQLKTRLLEKYRELRDGLGVHKDPQRYGAIPTDAYSHTPAHAGAQQPGMTGQVKEDILIRIQELGIRVASGCLRFNLDLLPREELLKEPRTFALPMKDGEKRSLEVPADALVFTFCGIPILYRKTDGPGKLIAKMEDGSEKSFADMTLPQSLSKEIFNRSGRISRIEVELS